MIRTTLRAALLGAAALALTAAGASADQLADVKAKGELTLATDMHYAPFDMLTNGTYEGMTKDLFDEVAKDLGVKPNYMDVPWTAELPGLEARKLGRPRHVHVVRLDAEILGDLVEQVLGHALVGAVREHVEGRVVHVGGERQFALGLDVGQLVGRGAGGGQGKGRGAQQRGAEGGADHGLRSPVGRAVLATSAAPALRGAQAYWSQDGGQVQSMLARAGDGVVVAGIGMAHDPGGGVVPQHALDPAVGLGRAVAADHHAGMLRESHADPAAVMQADPGRARGAVEQLSLIHI